MTQQSRKFLEFSKMPLMIKADYSGSPQKTAKQMTTYTPRSLAKMNWKAQNNESNHLVVTKIQKMPDHRCCHMLTLLVIVMAIIFCMDVYYERRNQMSTGEIERKQCYKDYQQNECLNPVDVLKVKCQQLQICYSLNSKQNTGILETAAKIVGKTVNSLLTHTTIFGAVLIIVLLAAAMLFAFKSNSQQVKFIYKNKDS